MTSATGATAKTVIRTKSFHNQVLRRFSGFDARWPRWPLPLLLAVLIILVTTCGSALAHASLLQSEPTDGSVLPQAPKSFVLTFNEPVSPIALRLVDADGAGADLTAVGAENETLTITLPPIRNGTHALSWRVISSDGHAVGGSIIFSIGAADGRPIAVAGNTAPDVVALMWTVRLLLYCCLFVGIGGRFFATWIAESTPLPPPADRLITTTLVVGLGAVALALGLQGLDVVGADLRRLLDGNIWFQGFITSYAATLAIAAFGLLLALVSGRIANPFPARLISAAALLSIGAAFAVSGHASTAPPEILTRPAVFVHGIAIAFWVGSLLPLALLIRRGGPPTITALTCFSRVIPVPVGLLLASGLLLAVIQLGTLSALWTTPYGLVLDGKLVLVVTALGFATWNRFALTHRVKSGGAVARLAMVRTIVIEMVLIAAILGLVSIWRFTPPPRAAVPEAIASQPIRIHVRGPEAMADLTIAPGNSGPSTIAIAVLNAQFGQLDSKGVTLTLSNPVAGVQPIRREARHIDGANWAIDVLTIPTPGKWLGKLDILVSDFKQTTLEVDFELQR
jgi:copper transport protein